MKVQSYYFCLMNLAFLIHLGNAALIKTKCVRDSDCQNTPYWECNLKTNICDHKDIFPIFPLEFVGIIVLPIVLALANAAGVGGGGIIVPFSIVFWSFGTKEAIALSTFSIFISSIVRYVYNWK